MQNIDPQVWSLKVRALLLPTPLHKLDPEGEAERERQICEVLKLSLPTEDDQDVLERARLDASDAQLGGAMPRPDSGTDIGAYLIHPLDPDTPFPAPDRQKVQDAWDKLMDSLQGRGPVHDATSWTALWYTYMREPVFQTIPHDVRMPDHSIPSHRSLTAALVGARWGGDEAALLLVQLGPVQDFIEASRRTHDLWGGSYLMSYLSYQALHTLAGRFGPDVILSPFPGELALARKLLFGDPDVKNEDLVQPSLPAKVFALVPSGDLGDMAKRVPRSVRRIWRGMGKEVCLKVVPEKMRDKLKYEGWDQGGADQLNHFLEVSTLGLAWPGDGQEAAALLARLQWQDPYPRADRVAALWGALSGVLWQGMSAFRKTVLPHQAPGDPRPKCSVCGQREQLGPPPSATPSRPGEGLGPHRGFWEEINESITKLPDREGLQISDGEGLCAVCLTRRFAPRYYFGEGKGELGLDWGSKEDERDRPLLRYPSVPSIATAPFRYLLLNPTSVEGAGPSEVDRPALETAITRWANALTELHGKVILDFTPPGNGIPGLGALGRSRGAQAELLNAEGSWLDEDAYQPERAWRDHHGRNPGEAQVEQVKRLREVLPEALKAFKQMQSLSAAKPCHYMAVLYLDGDQMSRWLNGSHDLTPKLFEVWKGDSAPPGDPHSKRPVYPALQAEVSRRLSGLATGPVGEVVHRYLGRLVYCGGDDVVALLPLATALPCAREVAKLFQKTEHLGPRVGASAGVAIVPMRDPLGYALKVAREMEKAAKNRAEADREAHEGKSNGAFGIKVIVRSGDPVEVVLPWTLPPSASSTDGVDVVDGILDLLTPGENGEPVLNLDLGYTLRDEIAALKCIPGAFQLRLNHWLKRRGASDSDEAKRERQRLAGLLYVIPKAATVLSLLMLARFLSKEEGGIPTRALLTALGRRWDGSNKDE